jgi:hypothetical protein
VSLELWLEESLELRLVVAVASRGIQGAGGSGARAAPV